MSVIRRVTVLVSVGLVLALAGWANQAANLNDLLVIDGK